MNILTFFFFSFYKEKKEREDKRTWREGEELLQILKGKGGEKKTDWSTIFNKKEHREGRRPASRRVGRNKYIAKKNPYFFVEKK